MPSTHAPVPDEPDDGAPNRAGVPVGRRAAQALVDGLVDGQAQRARSFAATLVAVADLVEEMSAPGGPTAPLAGTSNGAGRSTPGAGSGGTGPRAGSPAATRARRRAHARTVRAYATGDPVEATTAEIALALHLTANAAARLVDDALALTTDLPTTLTALSHGITDEPRARVVVAGTAHLSSACARWVDAHLTDLDLAELTTAELRARVAHLTALSDPHELTTRTREGTCARAVHLTPLPDGMAQLSATGPALDLAGVFDALTGIARDRTGTHGHVDPHAGLVAGLDPLTAAATPPTALPDTRGVDARRFDALVDALTGAGTSTAGPPRGPGGTAAVGGAGATGAGSAHSGRCHGPQVVVAMTSLLGLDDEPAQLAGVGPVPVHHLRGHLTEHPYRRAFTDPVTGDLVALDGHLTRPSGPPRPTGQEAPALPTPLEHLAVDGPRTDLTTSTTPTRTGTGTPGPAHELSPDDDAEPPETEAPETEPTISAPAEDGTTPVPRRGTRARRRPDCPVTAVGGGPYVPTPATQRHVRARETRCTYPGCRIPSTRCDLDHVRSYATGGPTCPCNLAPLCRRHHLAKHHFGWDVTPTTDDPHDTRLTWTSALGRTTTTHPEPLLPPSVDGLPAPATRGDAAARPRYPTHDTAHADATWAREVTDPDPGHPDPDHHDPGDGDEPPTGTEQHHEHRRPRAWHDDPPPS